MKRFLLATALIVSTWMPGAYANNLDGPDPCAGISQEQADAWTPVRLTISGTDHTDVFEVAGTSVLFNWLGACEQYIWLKVGGPYVRRELFVLDLVPVGDRQFRLRRQIIQRGN